MRRAETGEAAQIQVSKHSNIEKLCACPFLHSQGESAATLLTQEPADKRKPVLTHLETSNNLATIILDLRYVTGYGIWMIRAIRHKGLKRLYEADDPRGVIAEHADKLRDILARLDAVLTVADMDVPGLRLHPLKGSEKGFWAVTVRANWRVIFRFADHDAFDVDYVDYH